MKHPLTEQLNVIYRVYEDGKVDISVYDIEGRMLKNIVNENKEVGEYFVQADFSEFAPGLYMVLSKNGGMTMSERVAKIR